MNPLDHCAPDGLLENEKIKFLADMGYELTKK